MASTFEALLLAQVNLLQYPPMFRMHQSVSQSIPNATSTTLTMDTPDYDDYGGRSGTSPFGYTIPAGFTGRWRFVISGASAQTSAFERDLFLYRNGVAVAGSQQTTAAPGLDSALSVLTIPVQAGDVMTAVMFQQTGSTQSTFVSTNLFPYFEGSLVSRSYP